MRKIGNIDNKKHIAWDIMRDNFWRLGRDEIKPHPKMVERYLSGIQPGDKCCIIGASTYSVIQSAIERGINITVVDFSEKMCLDIEKAINDKLTLNIISHDILHTIPEEFYNQYKYIITDRLINRFCQPETTQFLKNISKMLILGGEFRTVVRMGLYELDKTLISYQMSQKIEPPIFDKVTNTINFFNARKVLADLTLTNGNIPSDILLYWYVNRGNETRYTEDSIEKLILSHNNNYRFSIKSKLETPDTTPSIYYQIQLMKSE